MKRIIAIFLCLLLVLSLSTCIFANENDNTLNVVTLGSSQTLGFGLPGFLNEKFAAWAGTESEVLDWETNGWNAKTWNHLEWCHQSLATSKDTGFGLDNIIPGAYPDLLRNALEKEGYTVNLSQLATTSMRANDLCAFLYDDYSEDVYHKWFFDTLCLALADTVDEGHEILTMKYRTALSEADIITYDLGAGNFALALEIFYGRDDIDTVFKNILSAEEYEVFSNFRIIIKAKVDKLIADQKIDKGSWDYYEQLLDKMSYNLVGFCKYFDKAMDWIYTNNPDARVVVMEIQNMCPDCLYYFGGIELYTNDVTQILIDIANNYTASFSKYADRYYYAANTQGERYSSLIDDLRAYEGKEDLTPELIEFCDLYKWTPIVPAVKTLFTPIYENAGGTVHDENYDDALNNEYDVYLKLIKYIFDSDYSAEDRIEFNDDMQILKNITIDMLEASYIEYTNKGDNSESLDKAIDDFEKLPLEVKRGIKNIVCGNFDVLLHPSYKGNEEMKDAVMQTLEFGALGSSAIPSRAVTGITNFSKTIKKLGSYIVDYSKQLAKEYIEVQAKEFIETKALETINTITNNIKNLIDKRIGNITGIIKMIK